MRYFDKQKLTRSGVYVIAEIFKINENPVKFNTAYYKYYYKGNRYEWKVKGPLGDSILFLRILPNAPLTCKPDYDVKVPKCLGIKNSPPDGWREIPKCKD
ncbi:hypothetical protein D3C80_1981380 [compost metagenome]